jgi:hypothetical protein
LLVAIDFDVDAGRLLVIDPGSGPPMTVLGSVRLPVYPVSLEVTDGHAYVGSYADGISVVDLADTRAPRLVATLPELGGIGELRADGPLLFANASGGLAMIDIRRPCRPQVLAQAEISLDQHLTPGNMELRSPQLGGLDARDGLVVAAGKDAGYYILRPTHVEDLPPAGEPCRAPRMIYLPFAGL